MITRRFIEKIHNIFNELNYHETERLDLGKFELSAVKTLTHCKELEDAIYAVRMYQFCLKQWSKIEKVFKRKLQLFNEYEYDGNSLLSTVSDKEALGTYYITNGINKKVKEIFIASHSFDDDMFALGFKNGRFTVFEDGNYYIKYSKMSSSKMKVFDKNNNCLCNIVLSEDCDIFLEKNITQYDIVLYENLIGIYDRYYIDSLETDIVDTDKLLADIEWDILEKNSDLGMAKLNVYDSNPDLEMLLLFATSTFLTYQKYAQTQTAILTYMALKQ